MTNGKPKILDLISEVRELFVEDISKTVYWDFIGQFKKHLNEVDSSYNKEIALRIFDDYKRQMDAYVSNRWNESTVDWAWESARIAETLKQLYEKENRGEYISYFYDSLRKELNKIPTDTGTLARIEEYFVEVYIKHTFDEMLGIIENLNEKPDQNIIEHGQQQPSKKKLTAKSYALAFILDCHASDVFLNSFKQKEKEDIGKRKGVHGNTFVKNINYLLKKDLNSEQTLVGLLGDNWRDIVLSLSDNPKLLLNYLDSKDL